MALLKSTLRPLGILGGIPLPHTPPCLALPQPGEALRMLGAGLGGFWKPFFNTYPWAWTVLTHVRIAVHAFASKVFLSRRVFKAEIGASWLAATTPHFPGS